MDDVDANIDGESTVTGATNGASETLLTNQTEEGGYARREDGAGGRSANGNGEAYPAAYELTAPEGYPISGGALKGLNEMCMSANLSEEQGKAVMAYMQGNYTTALAAQQQAMQAQAKTWIGEFQADKEFGGDKFNASVADAQRALLTFDQGGTIGRMLKETGYGNNPDVLRIFARVGRALGEDRLVGKGGGAEDRPLEDRMYPNM